MSSRPIHYSYSRVAPISGTQLNSRELLSPNPSKYCRSFTSSVRNRGVCMLFSRSILTKKAERSYFTHELWERTHRNRFACFLGERAPQLPHFCFTFCRNIPLLMNSWVVWVHGLVGTHTHEFRLISVLILLSSGVSEQLNSTHSNHDEPWPAPY